MRLSTLVGAPAGSGVFRDNRAWHGATPNLGDAVRALPNVEYGAPWLLGDGDGDGNGDGNSDSVGWVGRTMPRGVWDALPTEHGRHVCRCVVCEPGVWPVGAGIMHPLVSKREEAKKNAAKTAKL